jgi:hypothetical protein
MEQENGVQPVEAPAEQQQQQNDKQEKKAKAPKQPKAPKPSQQPKQKKDVAVIGGKKQGAELIGITATKDGNFSAWYQELVLKAEMVEYYNEVRTEISSVLRASGSMKQLLKSPRIVLLTTYLADLRLLHPAT